MLQEISLGDIGTTIGTIVAGIIEMFREFFANVEWSEVISQIKEGLKNALIAASDGGKNDGILAGLLGIGAIAGLTKIIVPIVTAVDKLSKALGGSGLAKSIGTALKGVGGKTGLSGAFTALKTAIGAISAPVAIAVAAITAIAIGIKDLWDTSSTFRDSVSEMWDKIATAFSEAKTRIWDETLVPLGEQLSGLWDMIYSGYEESGLKDIFEQLVTLLGDQLSSRISEFIGIISNAFKTAGGIISGILTVLEGVITFVSGVFSGDWTQAWEGIENIVKGVVDAISSFFSGLWETITIILSPVTEFFSEVFRVLAPEGRLIVLCINPWGPWWVRKKGKLFECPTETSFSPLSVTQVKSFCERYGVVDRGRFGVYCPSLSDNPQHLARWGWCEKAGDRWWPALANAFMLSCVKKVEKPGLIGTLIPEGGLLKKNWAGQTIATRNQTKNF